MGDVEKVKEKAESLIYPKSCKIVTLKSRRSQAMAYRSETRWRNDKIWLKFPDPVSFSFWMLTWIHFVCIDLPPLIL